MEKRYVKWKIKNYNMEKTKKKKVSPPPLPHVYHYCYSTRLNFGTK